VRFVIGHSSDKDAELKVKVEQEEYGDFVRLDFQASLHFGSLPHHLVLGKLQESYLEDFDVYTLCSGQLRRAIYCQSR